MHYLHALKLRNNKDIVAAKKISSPILNLFFFFDLIPGAFYGDIALPNVNYDLELHLKKINRPHEESIEKLRKEIFLEGLQIEEEGLLDIYKAKEKHDEKIKNDHFKNRKGQEIKENIKRSSSESDKTKQDDNFKNKPQPNNLTKLIKEKESIVPPSNYGTKMLARKKSSILDDDFEQIEPKYFPRYDEFEQAQKYYTAEEDETDRKLKIQKERRRRIMHTGDPLTLELLEKEKMKNLTFQEIYLKSSETLDGQNLTDVEDNVVKLRTESSEQPDPAYRMTKTNVITKRHDKGREGRSRRVRNRLKENENLKMDNPRNCSPQKNGKRRLSKPNRKKKSNNRVGETPIEIMSDKKFDNKTTSFYNSEIRIQESEKYQNSSNNIEKVMERGRKTKRKQR